ncbi:helix-turn-helix transcriptional regulator [Microbulbifer sp. SAOS-129_SWC]|uniref:helix-turn-helix domain-containing protein n=1 Tax=Microbulbifer sp. SAOS-129_SWC TaxID=3145235 RepID=UPI003217915D
MSETRSADQHARLRRLGESFRRLRLARNISQEALADNGGVGLSTLKRLERGQGCTLLALLQLLAALDCAHQFETLVAGLVADLEDGSGRDRRRASAPRQPDAD